MSISPAKFHDEFLINFQYGSVKHFSLLSSLFSLLSVPSAPLRFVKKVNFDKGVLALTEPY
jgi:hypothetical protein